MTHKSGSIFFVEIQSVCQEFNSIPEQLLPERMALAVERGWTLISGCWWQSCSSGWEESVIRWEQNVYSCAEGEWCCQCGMTKPGKIRGNRILSPIYLHSGFIWALFIWIVEVAEGLSLFHFATVQTLVTFCFRITSIFTFLTTNLTDKRYWNTQWEYATITATNVILCRAENLRIPCLATVFHRNMRILTLSTRLSRSQVDFNMIVVKALGGLC